MRYLTVFALLFFAFACGSDGAEGGTTTLAEAMDEAEAAIGSNPAAASCLGKEGRSVCDFLPDDVLAKYLPEGYEKNGYKDTERKMTSACGVQMDHPTKTRKLTVPGMTMDVPVSYNITLFNITTPEKNAAQQFSRAYKTMTDAEKAELQARAKEEMDKKIAAGKITKEQAELAGGFLNMAGKAEYQLVEGIGDKAVSGGVRIKAAGDTYEELHVLTGGTYFTLKVDLGESRQHSMEAAKEIAQAIVAICD